jgi:phosphoesterase RecJ-like protein
MNQIKTMIERADTIIIIAHVRPDGDCIGASEGLRHSILHQFPSKRVWCRYEALDHLSFLGSPDEVSDDLFPTALVFSLDTANQERIYDQRYTTAKQLIRIDHHPHIDFFGDVDYVDTSSPSTCNIITRLLLEWNYVIPPVAAKALLTGMSTDTGHFRYRGVTADTFLQAARLLESGIDVTDVYQPLYAKTIQELQFLGYFLTKLQISPKGIVYVVISQTEIQQFALTDDAAANFVGQLSDIKDHPIWFLLYETTDHEWRIRLRSDSIAIHHVASDFQGGGHPFASGCKLTHLDQLPEFLHALETLL